MFDERYERMMAGIEPSPELVQRTLHAARTRRAKPGAWKPVLVAALCVLMVAGAAAWRLLHAGTVPPETVATDDPPAILPVSDGLTLSVSDVTLVDEHELRFVLTISGDLVDPLTAIDYRIEGVHAPHRSRYALDPLEGQPPNEQRYQFVLQNDDQPILESAEDALTLSVIWYTTGDEDFITIHEVDWSAVTATQLPRLGDPLIPLGGEVAVSALAYSVEDGLSVQLRWPADSWETTMAFPQLILAATNDYPEDFIPWDTFQYTEDGWILHNTSFQVTRDELAALRLVTYTHLTGQAIRGDWRITIDLTPLKAD